MNKSYAETLVNDFENAARRLAHLRARNLEGVSAASRELAQKRADLVQALTVPSVHSEEFPDLRDQFAMAAMPGILSNGGCYGHIDGQGDEKRLSELAYIYADAMLQARKTGAQ